MSEAEHALFDRLFPRGFAGQDVLDEIAPRDGNGYRLACFHPPIERIFEERLLMPATWKNAPSASSSRWERGRCIRAGTNA